MTVKEVTNHWKPVGRPKAVRDHCIECAGGQTNEVTLCTCMSCPLWGWRFGTKAGSKAFIDRMELARKNKPDEFDAAYAHLGEGE